MTDDARRQVRKQFDRDQPGGKYWNDLEPDVQARLRRLAKHKAEDGDDPKTAGKKAIRRGQREGWVEE